MGAIKGRPKATAKATITSVESVAAYSQKNHPRAYLVIATMKVSADSPAEASRLVQDTVLGEPHLTLRFGPAHPAWPAEMAVNDGS